MHLAKKNATALSTNTSNKYFFYIAHNIIADNLLHL
jgi:hypothetical protein